VPRFLLAGAAAALVALGSTVAGANGRFPASNQLVFSPADPNLVILRTTFGILISHDNATTWSWLCEDALGLPPTSSADPPLGLTGSDALVAGIYRGLEVSRDVGCTWTFAGGQLAGAFVSDLAVRPNAPHTLVAIESTYGQDAGADGGTGYANQAFESTDDGATWSPLGAPIDPSVLVTTIDVAASDPQRLYVSGFRLATSSGGTNAASLFVSVDSAAHWTERPLPSLVDETAAYIAAVDPSNADLVYVRTEGNLVTPSQSRLLVTSNAGQSFDVALAFEEDGDGGVSTVQMLGFALSPDGSKVYAGSARDGVYVGARGALPDAAGAFQKVATSHPIHVQCLATRGSELWACSDEVSGFLAGVSNDDGVSFTPKLHLDGVASVLACAADATAAQCQPEFPQLCAMLGGCAGEDGGSTSSDAAAGDSGSPPPSPTSKSSSRGCSVLGGGGATGAVCAGAAAALLAAAARRRRRR
jgi:hypothetical protein